MPVKIASLTLAAGTNSRMPPKYRPKACVLVGGRSVIRRANEAYQEAGVSRHVIVVGKDAGPIRAQFAGRRDVEYALQEEPRGTGDAARCGLNLLAEHDPPHSVLISAGDKVMAPGLIKRFLNFHRKAGVPFSLVAGRSEDNPGSGRIIERDGSAFGIAEVPDIRVRQLAAALRSLPESARPATRAELQALASKFLASPAKLAKCLPDIARQIGDGGTQAISWSETLAAVSPVPDHFDLPHGSVTVEEADQSPWANLSLYVGELSLIQEAIEKVRSNNAQGEWYLTDLVQILAAEGTSVGVFRLPRPEDLMAFNTVEELVQVQRVFGGFFP